MSDYISHIVEQSMGIAESVQPLIVPMFAPPSFSAFISLDDMMPPPDSVSEEATDAPPLQVPINAPDSPESLSQPIAHDQSSQPLPKAERQSEQPIVQPPQREPTPAAARRGKALPRPLPIQSEQAHAPTEPRKDETPTQAGQSLAPTMHRRDGYRGMVGAGVDVDEGLGGLSPPVRFPSVDEGLGGLSPPVRFPSVDEGLEGLSPPVRFSTESPMDGAPTRAEQSAQASRGVGLPRPLPIPAEQTSRGVGLPRPLPERSAPIQEGQTERAGQAHAPTGSPADVARRAGQAHAPTVSKTAPAIPPMPPQPEIVARGDKSIQEMNVTTKTDEVTIAADITTPREQPSRASHPLDALVQQQSAFYPASLLPGEISLPANRPREENRRYAMEATGNERTPEVGAEQRLLTTSTRRDGSANELEPIIRVSIGRVEVRAVTSPAALASKRAAPAAPALSLTDYLQRRKGETG